MIISVASGKGGTGKTTIATNLAMSLSGVQLLDCDVEEPNSYIFIKPDIKERKSVAVSIPEVDYSKCTFCGKCQQVCVYNAIAVIKKSAKEKSGSSGKVLIFPELCHSCGSCSYFCPTNAIREVDREIGTIEIGNKSHLQFIHGKLNIGEVMSPPLIKAVKKYISPSKINIIDAPPGTSCPVIESIKDSDFCVLVTEPTPFGLNDLMLAVSVVRKLNMPFGVVINRSDLGDDKTDKFCAEQNIPVLMKIPFKKEIAVVYSKGELIVEALPEYKKKFQELSVAIEKIVNKQ